MDKEQIIQYFLLFTDLTQEELPRWEGLVQAAIGEVTARLNPEVDLGNYLDNLHLYTASLAYYRYTLTTATSSKSEIRLGELSVKSESVNELKTAKQIVREFEEPLIGILQSNYFYFAGVI